MTRRIALFFTAGISDLKFVAEDGTLLELAKTRGRSGDFASIRNVHEALLAYGKERIAVFPFDDVPESAMGRGRADVSFLREGDLLSEPPVTNDMSSFPLRHIEDGRLLMAADKFLPAWQAIRREKANVVAVVGFGTRREARDDEPIAAEELILEKLRAALKPGYADLVAYAQGRDVLESDDGSFSAEALFRIEAGVRACRKQFDMKPPEPWLATSGGIPAVKDVLRAAVELHFGPTRSVLRREGGEAASFRRAPQDSLVARRHALEFVRRGALIEASATAYPFNGDPEALRWWVQPLRCAARLLDGNPLAAYAEGRHPGLADDWERALPPPDFLQQLARSALPGRGMPKLRCLLPGVRAEVALRSGKWIEAINLTVTFFDNALRDAIERKLGLFERDREIRLARPLTEEEAKLLLCTPFGPDERPCLRPGREENVYRFQSSKAHDDAWCEYVGGALQALNQHLNQETAKGDRLRNLRNKNTHEILDDKEVEAGRKAFVERGLWQQREGDRRLSLLDAPAGRIVLDELGYAEANPIDRILSTLEARLKGESWKS